MFRAQAKKLYKEKRIKDGIETGCRINDLVQELHLLEKMRKLGGEIDSEKVQSTLDNIMSLRKKQRFREDFPTFSSFKKFLKENNVSLEEVKEIDESSD